MGLTLREIKGNALTIKELDDNFRYFTGSHTVSGSVAITEGITVGGKDPFQTLNIEGSGSIGSDLSVGNNITVSGAASAASLTATTLTIQGATIMSGSLTGESVQLSDNLNVSGNLVVHGTGSFGRLEYEVSIVNTGSIQGRDLIVTGFISSSGLVSSGSGLDATTTAHGNLVVEGSSQLKGTTISGSLLVNDTTITGSLQTKGNITVSGSVNAHSIQADGDTVLSGLTTVDTLVLSGSVSSSAKFLKGINVTGSIDATGSIKNQIIETILPQDGPAGYDSGSLKVLGNLNVTNDVTSSAKVDFRGSELKVGGNALLQSATTVTGLLTAEGGMTVAGNVELLGSITGSHISASGDVYGSNLTISSSTATVIFGDLPITEPTLRGQIWISGSTATGNSGLLAIKL